MDAIHWWQPLWYSLDIANDAMRTPHSFSARDMKIHASNMIWELDHAHVSDWATVLADYICKSQSSPFRTRLCNLPHCLWWCHYSSLKYATKLEMWNLTSCEVLFVLLMFTGLSLSTLLFFLHGRREVFKLTYLRCRTFYLFFIVNSQYFFIRNYNNFTGKKPRQAFDKKCTPRAWEMCPVAST